MSTDLPTREEYCRPTRAQELRKQASKVMRRRTEDGQTKPLVATPACRLPTSTHPGGGGPRFRLAGAGGEHELRCLDRRRKQRSGGAPLRLPRVLRWEPRGECLSGTLGGYA